MQIHEDTPTPPSAGLSPMFRMHAELCKALANEHRQAILHAIADGEKCVKDLGAEIGISVFNVSQHLRVLKERGLVATRKDGQTVYYRVANMKIIQACSLIREALMEQHAEQGESLQAAELYESARKKAGATKQLPAQSPPRPAPPG